MPDVNDKRAVYSNHCTPQEFPADGSVAATRWFLDSDCGRKLTGKYATAVFTNGIFYDTQTSNGVLENHTANGPEFVFLKNNGAADVNVSLDGTTTYVMVIAPGEAVAFECYDAAGGIAQVAYIYINSSSTPSVEYYIGY
jgi:hypothetical protein|tara:strand:- start:1877 stop:2296 length:420 start_codon:yes stop_codon:yes gene_type:complete